MIEYAGGKVYTSTGIAHLMKRDNTVDVKNFGHATDAAHWIANNTNLLIAFTDYDESAKDNVWVYGKRGESHDGKN